KAQLIARNSASSVAVMRKNVVYRPPWLQQMIVTGRFSEVTTAVEMDAGGQMDQPETALVCIWSNQLKIYQYLLNHGATIAFNGHVAVIQACRYARMEFLTFFDEKQVNFKDLPRAITAACQG